MAEQTVELQPSESKVVTFEAVPSVAKTYQVAVDGLAGSFRAVEAPPPKTAVIAGQVTNTETGQAIKGVKVTAAGKETYTNLSGWYWLTGVPVGTYWIAFSASGFEPQALSKTLTIDDLRLDIALTPFGVGLCEIKEIVILSEGGRSYAPPVVGGGTVVVDVVVRNWSGLVAPYHLEVYVNETKIGTHDGTLKHGQVTARHSYLSPTEAGIYTAKADLDYGREVLTKDFEVLPS